MSKYTVCDGAHKFASRESSLRFGESSLRFVESKFASKESSLRFVESSLLFVESSLRFAESSLHFVESSLDQKNQVFVDACELNRTRYHEVSP